jgi:lipopolysaccharide/colanic/teichoic acid biosynthesis glycosyltransferase
MWKFRTMTKEADTSVHKQYVSDLLHSEEPLFKLDHDELLIPMGIWFRKLCIDELPQLFNVLGGSMSLVGPRPDVVAMEEYPYWQHRRFDAIPGMTGLWQVSGKNTTTHERMVQLDIEYATQLSPWMDIQILLKTVPVVLGQASDQNKS